MFLFVIQSVVTEAPAEVSTSLLVVDNNTTNSEMDTSVHDSCNNTKDGWQAALLRFSKAECFRLSMDI